MSLSTTDQMKILERLRSARNIVFFTGAGLSAESGIPTFRDASNSLWAKVDPMTVVSIDGFNRDPERVWAWHDEMRKLFSNTRPNAGHEAIAELERLLQPAKVQVITQNIDSFHQEAGSSWVLEIHGTARRVRCHRRCGYVTPWEDDTPRQCPACAAPLRPDLVWFGEALDEALFNLAQEVSGKADVFFIVGTSGVVYPAAGLADTAKYAGAMVIEVNPGETPHSKIADYSVRASASNFFPSLCVALRKIA